MSLRRLALLSAGSLGTAAGYYFHQDERRTDAERDEPWHHNTAPLPARQAQLSALKRGRFDVLVIGGGATGAGIALDAASRGLNTALVEAEDFAAGTSSRSTKLVHGGVRYLEKAVMQLDVGQLKLVFEALHERGALLRNAPHLTNPLPTLTPCYKLWEVPYYWAGLKAYDILAGAAGLTWSHFMSASETIRVFPQLAQHNFKQDGLKGAVVYFDGQMDDARLNVALATTATAVGATVLNYVSVVSLLKDAAGKVVGAVCKDVETGTQFDVRAKCVVNAAGPFCDGVRKMVDSSAKPMICPSSGVHLTLPSYYSPKGYGMIVPKTKDGRVVFVLPWLGATVAGTTDKPTDLTMRPRATAEEVDFILETLADYLAVPVSRHDVLSAWSGIRPLAADPTRASTENLVRDHVVATEAGMVTVSGGKWTTYRRMAQDAVDVAVEVAGLQPARRCRTHDMRLVGGGSYAPHMHAALAQTRLAGVDMAPTVARHLARAYGDRAPLVVAIAAGEGLGKRLDSAHPVLEAEVAYAARHEMCRTASDFLARRSRLAFLDVPAAKRALPRVVEVLGGELGWGRRRRSRELASAQEFLKTFEAAV